jgi:hypothetical protein
MRDEALVPPSDGHLTLPEVAEVRRVQPQDCRRCANFAPAPGGMNYGSCQAHKMLVKLYHSDQLWFSQCQFKALRLERPPRILRGPTQADD